jgi:HxlR-like helix-turn-helix protein
VLTDRLARLCAEGILRRVRYQERPERFEYRLTRKAVGLWPALMSLMLWGDQYYADDGPPVIIVHRGCGGALTTNLSCAACGDSLGPADVEAGTGPGAAAAPGEPSALQHAGR